MPKLKIEGVGPLSYLTTDNQHGSESIKLKQGDEIIIEFKKKFQVYGSPFNPARCNVIIRLIEDDQ